MSHLHHICHTTHLLKLNVLLGGDFGESRHLKHMDDRLQLDSRHTATEFVNL